MKSEITNAFDNHSQLLKDCQQHLTPQIERVSTLIFEALNSGKKIIFFGNGGSASDSQHLSAEFVGRFKKERKSLRAIALNTDSSATTAIGNDYGFEFIFSRQVEGLADKGDILFGISTSGNSENVINAFKEGLKLKTINIALTGNDGGQLSNYTVENIIVRSNITARIQEMHIFIGHIICEIIDNQF